MPQAEIDRSFSRYNNFKSIQLRILFADNRLGLGYVDEAMRVYLNAESGLTRLITDAKKADDNRLLDMGTILLGQLKVKMDKIAKRK